MITDKDQVLRLAREHGDDPAFVINHSGGKDSTSLTTLAVSRAKGSFGVGSGVKGAVVWRSC